MKPDAFERILYVIENKRNDDLLGLPPNYVKQHWDWHPVFSSEWESTVKLEFKKLESVPGNEYRLVRYAPEA